MLVLDKNFLELLHNQVNKLIVNMNWMADEKTATRLAAYRCGIEFGKYKNQQVGFLTNTLKSIVPKKFAKGKMEQNVLNIWKEITAVGEVCKHSTAVQSYLFAA